MTPEQRAAAEAQAEAQAQQAAQEAALQELINRQIQNFLSQNPQTHRHVLPEFKKKHADMIPVFTGKPETLQRFLQMSEMLVERFCDELDPDNFQNHEVIGSILQKIQGPAADTIQSYTFPDFQSIKTALLDGYTDRRDLYTLCHDLTAMRHSENESPFNFHEKIRNLLATILAYIKNHSPPNSQETLAEHYKGLALRTLTMYLREPLGSQLRTRQPKSLAEALTWMTNDYQTWHNSRRSNNQTQKPPNPNNNNKPQNQRPIQQNQKQNPNNRNNNNLKPQYNPNNNFKPNQQTQFKYQNQKTQNQFQNKPPNQFQTNRPQYNQATAMSWQTTNPNLHNMSDENEDVLNEPQEEEETFENPTEEEHFLEENSDAQA